VGADQYRQLNSLTSVMLVVSLLVERQAREEHPESAVSAAVGGIRFTDGGAGREGATASSGAAGESS